MKATVLLAMCLIMTGATLLVAGPSAPHNFVPSITRQDFTGQGSFHRQGIVREQDRALAAQRKASSQISKTPSALCRFWQSLFPPKP